MTNYERAILQPQRRNLAKRNRPISQSLPLDPTVQVKEMPEQSELSEVASSSDVPNLHYASDQITGDVRSSSSGGITVDPYEKVMC